MSSFITPKENDTATSSSDITGTKVVVVTTPVRINQRTQEFGWLRTSSGDEWNNRHSQLESIHQVIHPCSTIDTVLSFEEEEEEKEHRTSTTLLPKKSITDHMNKETLMENATATTATVTNHYRMRDELRYDSEDISPPTNDKVAALFHDHRHDGDVLFRMNVHNASESQGTNATRLRIRSPISSASLSQMKSDHEKGYVNGDEEDNEDQLNILFNHDKDYVDIKPIRRRADPPSIVRKIPASQQPPKLRSFSDPEIRDVMDYQKWWNETTAFDATTTTTTHNVLRNRHNRNHNQLDDSMDGLAVLSLQTQVGLRRNRAYTADTTTTLSSTPPNRPRRSSVDLSSTGDDDTNTSWLPMADIASASIWYHHERSHNKKYHRVSTSSSSPPAPRLQSFHASWDDEIDHHRTTSFITPEISATTDPLMPVESTSSSLVVGTAVATNEIASLSTIDMHSPLPMVPRTSTVPPSTNPSHHHRDRTEYSIIHPTNTITTQQESDHERIARLRWIQIHHRFQMLVAMVVLMFSCLLLAIMGSWIVFAATVILDWEKSCDLKQYFWLASFQLLLDVFRTDILRIVLRWNPQMNESTPGRVMVYNLVYLIYAIVVLQLGIKDIVARPNECHTTAPELFSAGVTFVSFTIAAWMTILFGYIIPFCAVAILLTLNGYNPHTSSMTSGSARSDSPFPFNACGYSTSGAIPECVEKLNTIEFKNLTDGTYPKECCICMESFNHQDVIVTTRCQHIFHKSCCREWLRQARTCPVCRDDIPSSLEYAVSTVEGRPDNVNAYGTVTPLIRALYEVRDRFTENGMVYVPRGASIAPITSAGLEADVERGL